MHAYSLSTWERRQKGQEFKLILRYIVNRGASLSYMRACLIKLIEEQIKEINEIKSSGLPIAELKCWLSGLEGWLCG